MLVTTEKDWVRLPDDDSTELCELKFRSRPLLIDIEFADGNRLKRLLVETIEKRRQAKPYHLSWPGVTALRVYGVGWVSRKRFSEAAAST